MGAALAADIANPDTALTPEVQAVRPRVTWAQRVNTFTAANR
jgi:hypothetical protein